MSQESEWLTRKQRIDFRLKKLGWRITPYSDGTDLNSLNCVAVEELPTANGPADYGLFVGGQLLAIIEAKKVTINPQNVLEQARRYAGGVFAGVGEWDGCAFLSSMQATERSSGIWMPVLRNEYLALSRIFTAQMRSRPDLRKIRNLLMIGSAKRLRNASGGFDLINESASSRLRMRSFPASAISWWRWRQERGKLS